jgi:hypothetical protein
MVKYILGANTFLLYFLLFGTVLNPCTVIAKKLEYTNNSKHAVWGKVLKTKTLHGHNYFIYFKSEGKNYAYPLSTKSSIKQKKLDSLAGKYARIYGKERLEQIKLEGSKHILTFEVTDVKELKLSDLNQNLDDFKERMDIVQISKRQITSDKAVKDGISDKTVNTAIFVGGAILAAEVLSVLITH